MGGYLLHENLNIIFSSSSQQAEQNPPLSLTHSTNTTRPPLHTTKPSLSKYPSNSRSTSHSLGGTTSTFPLFISSKCRPTCSNLFSQLSGPWKFCVQKIQRLVVGGRRDWWWQIEASVVR